MNTIFSLRHVLHANSFQYILHELSSHCLILTMFIDCYVRPLNSDTCGLLANKKTFSNISVKCRLRILVVSSPQLGTIRLRHAVQQLRWKPRAQRILVGWIEISKILSWPWEKFWTNFLTSMGVSVEQFLLLLSLVPPSLRLRCFGNNIHRVVIWLVFFTFSLEQKSKTKCFTGAKKIVTLYKR